ncbi:flavodoxin family protein [Nocardioides marmoribigeumensis]|uniref:Multimeric flavodoxin WrbA n=1 Tax=Nocardioides marmoribigeumensis TaxID=433649 RepID=A0ABU2BYI3_9ACTN|nr:NAD(P)H-dependent oxidoreductase [Nocardioides marmoribigeumensis]MDR7363461.1 multimeric flavodoxin WrbA [Nocardioides marmoribigeumensis]
MPDTAHTDLSPRVLVLVCTLKKSPAPSSAEKLGTQLLDEMRGRGATGEVVRVVDHDVRFGVSTDEGDGDEWPAIRQKMLDADVLVLATPIWLGQPSSVAKLVMERLDAEISETDDEGRLLTFGKVAAVVAVGNEDGAHHVVAEALQALNDTGFSVAANTGVYWVGEAMHGTDYNDLDETPEAVASTLQTAALNTVHLARLLAGNPYPAP